MAAAMQAEFPYVAANRASCADLARVFPALLVRGIRLDRDVLG